MAGRADPTFAQRAGAAPSQLDGLLDELLVPALAAARLEVQHETLDYLGAKLFMTQGRQPPPLAEAEQQLAERRQRIKPQVLAGLRDQGASHWKTVARFERYIALRQQNEAKAQQVEAAKEIRPQEMQQRQQHEEAPPPPPDEQQQAAGGGWLQRALSNQKEARQEEQQRQLQEQRIKSFAAPKPVAPGSRYNTAHLGYDNDSADFRNNAPQANRGAPAQQSKRHQQLLNVSGAAQPKAGSGRGGGRGGRGAQPKQQRLQGLDEHVPLATKCKFCFNPPAPGKQLKEVKFKDNGERVVACYDCLQKNEDQLVPLPRKAQQSTMDAALQPPSQHAQHGKPRVQGVTSQTGLTAKPQGAFYPGNKPTLPLHRSTAGGAAAAAAAAPAGGATGRGPMRGKGKQQQQRRKVQGSDDEDYVPAPGAAGQGSDDDDSLMGAGVRPRRPSSRRGTRLQQANSEPICIDLLSDEDGGGSVSPPDSDPAAAAAAAAAGGPAAAAGRRRPPRLTRVNQYMSTSERFQGLKCLYPPGGGPGAVEVTHLDLPRLDADEFLNDTVIDFYVRWLQDQLPPEVRQRCYFFNTFFFKKLTEKEGGKVTPEVEAVMKEKGWTQGHSMTRALLNHQKVKKWTKDVDLFSKDFIFVPVHEALHWSLMVVCHPGEVMPAEVKGTKSSSLAPGQKTPCILHLDSLSGSHNAQSVANTLRLYLQFEWLFKSQSGPEESVPRRWAAANPGKERKWLPDDIKYRPVKLPKQDNHCDCGLFVCSFIEFFTYKLPPAICTADLEELKKSYSKSVCDLFEGLPEGYYPGMLTEHWFPADNPSKLRWFIRLKVVELMAEQNGYLAAPGTEQEQWLEGPDPELKQRLQDEIGQLRSVVTNGGYMSPAIYQPMGEEAKQRRKAAAERRQQQAEQATQQQKAGRQARQAAAAKRQDDEFEYDADLRQPDRERVAAAAEARLKDGSGGSQPPPSQQQQQQQQHFMASAVQEVAQQGDSGGYEPPFEPEELPTGPARRQQQQQASPPSQQQQQLEEDGWDVEEAPYGETQQQPDPDFGVELQASPDLGTGDFPSSAQEIAAGLFDQHEAARPQERRRRRRQRQAIDEWEEEGEGEAQQQQQQQQQQPGYDHQGPAAALQQQGPPAPKRQRGGQPQPQLLPSDPSPSSSTADEDEELDIVDAGHHSRQHQQPPQYQQPPQPQQYQQPTQPAGSAPPEPPLQLDWGRLVRVSAEFVEEMDGPPEQAPDQQQRVELRFWYRDQGFGHQLYMRFGGSSTLESAVACYAWAKQHEWQLRGPPNPVDCEFRTFTNWLDEHMDEVKQAQQQLQLLSPASRACLECPPLQRNPATQPSVPQRSSLGQGNGGAAAGVGGAVGRVREAFLAEGALVPVVPLVAAAEDPLAQQQQQQQEEAEEEGYTDATEDSQALPATQEWSSGSGALHGGGWHDALSGGALYPDAGAAGAPLTPAAVGSQGDGEELSQQLDGMHLDPAAQQAQQAAAQQQERPWRQKDQPGGALRAAQLKEQEVQARQALQVQQAAGAGGDEVDLTLDEPEPPAAGPTPAQQQRQQHMQEVQQQWQEQHRQDAAEAQAPHQQPAPPQQGGAKRGALPVQQPPAGQQQAPQGSKRRRKAQPNHLDGAGLGWAAGDTGEAAGGAQPQAGPALQPAAEGHSPEQPAHTAKQRRQHRQHVRQGADQPDGAVATAAFHSALFGDPVQGAAAAAAAAAGGAGGYFAGAPLHHLEQRRQQQQQQGPHQLGQRQQQPQGQQQLGPQQLAGVVPHPEQLPSGLQQMTPRAPKALQPSAAVTMMARAGSSQAVAASDRPGSAPCGRPGSAASGRPGSAASLSQASGGSGGAAAGAWPLGQPAPVEHRYSAAGMQQAKQPLQQQNAFAAAAARAAAEAVTAAETSYVEKRAHPAGAPAGIDSSQVRAATQGVTANLRRVADLNRTQEQSTRRQARATAVAPLPAPSSSTVDLTGDAD